jgi:uncharacterized protein YjbI with pentapeptide repeats
MQSGIVMANVRDLERLRQGAEEWNRWRANRLDRGCDLRGANLHRAELNGVDLSYVDLREADLREARLEGANLQSALLQGGKLNWAVLSESDLTNARLVGADLSNVNLFRADLNGADLTDATLVDTLLYGASLVETRLVNANLERANLRCAVLVRANLERARLSNCRIYGMSAWDLRLDQTEQRDLDITWTNEPALVVDNLEVAQFVHLMLTGPKLREVLSTVATKAVLILGRFAAERKPVLDAIREALRAKGYVSILFDWEAPEERDVTETVTTLAYVVRFIIADLTGPKSVPHELATVIPQLGSVPVQPIIEGEEREYGMFRDLRKYSWVRAPYHYQDLDGLLPQLNEMVIAPAEAQAKQLTAARIQRESAPE